jgi:hypothetical protein
MFKTWTQSARDAETLARELEAHLNEYADEIISVCYVVNTDHHVLAVYRPVDTSLSPPVETAVAVAEHIIEDAQS